MQAEERARLLAELRELHADVDRRARVLAERHRERLQCRRGCADCCVDDQAVFAIEAERIRDSHGTLLSVGTPHPPGACAFLAADGSCRIYECRPYRCRTQGLPLSWLEADGAGDVAEFRDICVLNEAGPPVEALHRADCWIIGPVEAALGELAGRFDPTRRRVGLRGLFEHPASSCEAAAPTNLEEGSP